jgi:hypothetical protein
LSRIPCGSTAKTAMTPPTALRAESAIDRLTRTFA